MRSNKSLLCVPPLPRLQSPRANRLPILGETNGQPAAASRYRGGVNVLPIPGTHGHCLGWAGSALAGDKIRIDREQLVLRCQEFPLVFLAHLVGVAARERFGMRRASGGQKTTLEV